MTKADLERLNRATEGAMAWHREELEKDPIPNFSQAFMKSLEITDAEQTSRTDAKVWFRFPVLHEYLNHAKDLHGGSLGIIFDVVAAWPMWLIGRPDLWAYPGVTRSLRYVLLNPVKEGEMVLAEGETVHVGKKLALLKGVLKRERDGAIIATCEQERYMTIPPQVKVRL